MPPRVSDGRSWAAAELEPPVGPATCADPPSLCADWGRRETLQVLVPVLQDKHRHGGARGTQDRTDSHLESPSGKSRHGGRRGAPDPPGSRSGYSMVNSGTAVARPRRCPLDSHSGVPQRENRARRRRAPRSPPPPRPSSLPFGVFPGQETAGTLRTPGFPLRVPLPRLGSGRIPGCGPAA